VEVRASVTTEARQAEPSTGIVSRATVAATPQVAGAFSSSLRGRILLSARLRRPTESAPRFGETQGRRVASCCAFAGLSLDVSGLAVTPKPEFARFFAPEPPARSAVDQPGLIRNQQVAGSTPAGGFNHSA
jgi:hypothetical protein